MKLRIEQTNTFYYPGLMAVCGPAPKLDATFQHSACLVVEVISKSTAATDRHAKYAAYTRIPSLQTYLIVEQCRRQVYIYQRRGEDWHSSECIGSGEIDLPCLAHRLTLDEIYRGVLEAGSE